MKKPFTILSSSPSQEGCRRCSTDTQRKIKHAFDQLKVYLSKSLKGGIQIPYIWTDLAIRLLWAE